MATATRPRGSQQAPTYTAGGRAPRGALSPAERNAEKARRDQARQNAKDRREFERGEAADTEARKERNLKRAKRVARRAGPTPGGSAPASVQAMHIFVITLLLVALYWLLTSVETVKPFLGGIGSAFRWLESPHAVIGYGAGAKTTTPATSSSASSSGKGS